MAKENDHEFEKEKGIGPKSLFFLLRLPSSSQTQGQGCEPLLQRVEEEISRMSLLPSPTLREWTCFL
jgi:hypothetical protein